MRSIRNWCSIATLALFMAASPCLALPASAPGELLIRVGASPLDQATPLFYAAKVGLYKKYGLDVQIVKLPNGNAVVAAIVGGSLELGQGSPLSLIEAVSRGIPLTMIGNLSLYNAATPTVGVLVLADSPIKTPQDLSGKTLAEAALQDMNSLATFAWLDASGVVRSTIKIVEIPASSTLAAMEQHRVDASTFYEPFFSSFLSTGKMRVLGYPYSTLGSRFSDSVLYTATQWAPDHHDAIQTFLLATREAATYIAAHEGESATLIANFAGIDVSSLANIRPLTRSVPLVPGDLQPMIDAAAKYKLILQSFPTGQIICTCALHK